MWTVAVPTAPHREIGQGTRAALHHHRLEAGLAQRSHARGCQRHAALVLIDLPGHACSGHSPVGSSEPADSAAASGCMQPAARRYGGIQGSAHWRPPLSRHPGPALPHRSARTHAQLAVGNGSGRSRRRKRCSLVRLGRPSGRLWGGDVADRGISAADGGAGAGGDRSREQVRLHTLKYAGHSPVQACVAGQHVWPARCVGGRAGGLHRAAGGRFPPKSSVFRGPGCVQCVAPMAVKPEQFYFGLRRIGVSERDDGTRKEHVSRGDCCVAQQDQNAIPFQN